VLGVSPSSLLKPVKTQLFALRDSGFIGSPTMNTVPAEIASAANGMASLHMSVAM
jgi:hypothetical protein